ncbi:MAG: hypothetical protein HKN78_05590 [Sphingomonadaceae bacterium]|nr:hypothetical protein [Sphingomonadaceae bacterium]
MLRSLLGAALGRAASEKTLGRGMLGAGLGLIATRIATRSFPGAAVIGGGLVAKYLWDRKRERDAREADGETGSDDTDMAAARAQSETTMDETIRPDPASAPD